MSNLPAEPVILVANTFQARKVRWFFWGSFVFLAGFLYWAFDLAMTYGSSPGDGGVLRPLGHRLVAAAIVGTLGVLPAFGMWLYMHRYVAGLVWKGEEVLVTGAGWPGGERRFPLASFEPGRDHDGQLYTVTHWVNAPWATIKIARRTYIIDLQAEHIDGDGLARMFKEARRARTS
jgi:hypothetical protein